MRFGTGELFKEDKNDEESKKRLLSMDIDEILERAEKVVKVADFGVARVKLQSGVMTAETGTYRWIIVCINCINFRNFIPNFRIIV